MTTLHDDRFMSVTENNGSILLSWKSTTAHLNDEDFKNEALIFIELVKRNNCKKVMVDMRQFQFSLSPELIQWRNEKIISEYNKISLEKFAFISDHIVTNQEASKNTFATKYFLNEKEAENWMIT